MPFRAIPEGIDPVLLGRSADDSDELNSSVALELPADVVQQERLLEEDVLNDWNHWIRINILGWSLFLIVASAIGFLVAVVLYYRVEVVREEDMKPHRDIGCTGHLLAIYGAHLVQVIVPCILIRSETAGVDELRAGFAVLSAVAGFASVVYSLVVMSFGFTSCSTCTCPEEWAGSVRAWTVLGFVVSLFWSMLCVGTGFLHDCVLFEYPCPMAMMITIARIPKHIKEVTRREIRRPGSDDDESVAADQENPTPSEQAAPAGRLGRAKRFAARLGTAAKKLRRDRSEL
mmetsp:Transcript_25167/g.57214  ORF Transcript_25167/g.57214 Transcript_25167/m.57214 type:complete len:288 (-) Transcript_25167:196-1059(-)